MRNRGRCLSLSVFLLVFPGWSGICQEPPVYTDVRDNTIVELGPVVTDGQAIRQVIIHHFLYFPPELLGNVEDEASFRLGAGLQEEAKQWSGFAKLVHIVPMSSSQQEDAGLMRAIQRWAEAYEAIVVVVEYTDPAVLSEVGDKGTPLLHMAIHHLNGVQSRAETADPRQSGWKQQLFQMMEVYFEERFRIDDAQDWVAWLDNMKRVLPINLSTHYFRLGQERLKRGNQGRGYRELFNFFWTDHTPPVLAGQAVKDIAIAAEALERSIAEEPNQSEALNSLGIAYYRQRDYADALPRFQQAVSRDNADDPAYVHNLAIVYLKLGDKTRALRTLDDWLLTFPDDATGWRIRRSASSGDAPVWIPVILFTGAALADIGYTEITPKTPHENARDALALAQSVSNNPDSNAFESQRGNWGDYQRYHTRDRMLNWTAGNLFFDALPFWLDGLNWNPPTGKTATTFLYTLKALAFLGGSLYFNEQAKDAQADEASAESLDLQLHFHGQYEEAKELKQMFWVNAGIDAVAVLSLILFFHPDDGLPQPVQSRTLEGYNQTAPRFSLNTRSQGGSEREVLLLVRQPF